MEDKIKALTRVYSHLDRHVSAFKRRSGMACVAGCGQCCQNGELNAAMLEFLPAAYDLYLRGEAEEILDQIASKQDSICVFYNPISQGLHCTLYTKRGLICRLFGFSVKTDKHGNRVLVTCSLIKNSMDKLPSGELLEKAPSLSSYYMRLYGIDPISWGRQIPVNQAIKEAIEKVLHHFRYSGDLHKKQKVLT